MYIGFGSVFLGMCQPFIGIFVTFVVAQSRMKIRNFDELFIGYPFLYMRNQSLFC